MSTIDKDGMLSGVSIKGVPIGKQVISKRFQGIEHGKLLAVHAIVLHQTDAPTAQHSLNGYTSATNGAHFLIAKNGTIYQTASINQKCYHVGRLIKSKCFAINKKNCNSTEMAKIMALSWRKQINAINSHERAKSYPNRYPVNSDSIGIEIVGQHIDDTSSDVYKHPTVSYKNPGEASSAKWK